MRAIWLVAARPCGKRLAPALPLWLPHYQRLPRPLSARQRELLCASRPATLARLLTAARTNQSAAGPVRPQTLWPAPDPDPDPPRHLGSDAARLSGGRQRGPLRGAWKQRSEPARTACQRLMDPGVLGHRPRRELRERYESLDPFALRRELERG